METNFLSLRQWVESGAKSILDLSVLADIRSEVMDSIYQRNYEVLLRLHRELTPLAAKIIEQFRGDEIDLATIQAAEVSVLAAFARGTCFIMENDDSRSDLDMIRHGKIVLRLLLENQDKEFSLSDLRAQWPEDTEDVSNSTLSRVLFSLEKSGYIIRTGATRGRRYLLLEKAKVWYEEYTEKHSHEDHKKIQSPEENIEIEAVPDDESFLEEFSKAS